MLELWACVLGMSTRGQHALAQAVGTSLRGKAGAVQPSWAGKPTCRPTSDTREASRPIPPPSAVAPTASASLLPGLGQVALGSALLLPLLPPLL